MPGDLTRVPGIAVGHWNHADEPTGCTVVVLPPENETGVEVRGAAPGSRETDLLRPGMSVRRADAILLTGGSAFGLAAADGVVAGLEADGRGHPTPTVPVPIVPGAVIYDLLGRDPSVRPDATSGRAAYDAASPDPLPGRRSGAGAGASVGKWRLPLGVPGGIGSASREVEGAVVGALVVVNALGDVVTLDGRRLTGGGEELEPPFWNGLGVPPTGTNTTLVVVATDAAPVSVDRMALRAQDALAACIRPVHTSHDGDVAFAVRVPGGPAVDVDLINEAVFWTVAEAIEAAVTD